MHWTNVTNGGFLTIHPNFLQTFPILHELPQYSKVFLFIFATIYTPGFFIMFWICSMSDKGIWRQCPYDDLPKRDSVMWLNCKYRTDNLAKIFELASAPCDYHLHILVWKKQASNLQRCSILRLLIYKFVMQLGNMQLVYK